MAISISGNGRTTYGPRITRDGLVLYLDAANPNSMLSSVEVLVVAGGGGSGGGGNSGYQGGGGGGGGVVYHPTFSLVGETTVTVGQGGAGGTQSGDTSVSGTNGGDSQFSTLIAKGGGGGGAQNTQGSSGGSGGGGGLYSGGGGTSNQSTFSGATVYGNSGGTAQSNYTGGGAGGGGGGAGSAGGNASGTGIGGAGGQGVLFNMTGTGVYYGGGGAAKGGAPQGSSGNGAAANGATPVDTNGTANTGAGGGGVYATSGKAGGSGIVIIRYRGSQKATGGTITSVGGFTIHTFTSSGTFTPLFVDLSGRQLNGTLTNGPSFSSANSGTLGFDGSNDYIEVNIASSALQTSGPLTLCSWVYRNGSNSGMIFSAGGYYGLFAGGTYWYWNGNPNWVYYSCTLTIPQNQWYHYCLTYNGSSNPIFYVNGVGATSSGTYATPSVFGSNILRIGEYTVYLPYNPFFGRLASASFYNRVLTAAEISQLYTAGKARFGLQ